MRNYRRLLKSWWLAFRHWWLISGLKRRGEYEQFEADCLKTVNEFLEREKSK